MASSAKWNETALWTSLDKRGDKESTSIKALLEIWMPKIETVLARGGTSPTDFTLHDEEHSFRVAQRMAEIIPADVLPQLCSYELALLLLSAYLHDIGMTPSQRKVILLYNYILSGDTDDEIIPELDLLQKWLDDDEDGVTPPVAKGTPTKDQLGLARHLVTHYCRHRHNDWSDEWIRANAPTDAFGTYVGWVDDLVRLCHSHHQVKADLERDPFEPRPVGTPGQILHLRYLACVLRVADILEFDPERTPDVILRHRDIAPASLIFWQKDHDISLIRDGAGLTISARPASAKIHHAIADMLNDIDVELATCAGLSAELPFDRCKQLKNDLPHRWDLERSVHRDIEPKEGTYEYIDGAFRPNTRKMLELLSGIELYGHPKVAVRELLQNAFDAVREYIAYDRLDRDNPSDPTLEERLGKLYRVNLRLEARTDGTWLVCTDDGIGMTKQIITDHLLVSGRPRRHDVLALERKCQKAGFVLGRTGQFGIGVLSYFMIADRLSIRTRRGIEAGDADPNGWSFETEGVGSFGELRAATDASRGTRVELHLREEFSADPVRWYGELRRYLVDTLCLVPCEFRFNSSIEGCEVLSVGPGWVLTSEVMGERVCDSALESPYERRVLGSLIPWRSQELLTEERQELDRVRKEMLLALRWISISGDLPGSLGRYRLHLPYFQLGNALSLVYLSPHSAGIDIGHQRLKGMDGFVPSLTKRLSWHGMHISQVVKKQDSDSSVIKQLRIAYDHLPFHLSPLLIAEIDLHTHVAGTLRVDRTELVATKELESCAGWLTDRGRALLAEFATANVSSLFGLLNCILAQVRLPLPSPMWSVSSRGGIDLLRKDIAWAPIAFPAVPRSFVSCDGPGLSWNGNRVSLVDCVRTRSSDFGRLLSWFNLSSVPNRVVRHSSREGVCIVPVWTENPFQNMLLPEKQMNPLCDFPPEWRHLAGVSFDESEFQGDVWNRRCVLADVDDDLLGWIRTLDYISDHVGLFRSGLADVSKARALLRWHLMDGSAELWQAIREQEDGLLWAIWSLVFGTPQSPESVASLAFCEVRHHTLSFRIVTPLKWDSGDEDALIVQYLPSPADSEWVLEEVNAENAVVANPTNVSGPGE